MSGAVEPPVTVIVPAFNAEATLAETLESVAAQSYSNWECLIVDDGSTDGTPALAAAYCARDSRFRLLRKPNGGVASARNRGLGEAAGAFAAPLDADDIWHPDYLAKQVRTALRSARPPGFVFSFSRVIDGDSRVIRTVRAHPVAGPAVGPLLYQNVVGNGSALLLSRSAALAAGGYDERLQAAGIEGAEDYLFQLRIAARHEVAVNPEYLVGYRLTPHSMSSDPGRMIDSMARVIEIFAAETGTPMSHPALRRRRAGLALQLAWVRARSGALAEAAGLLLRAYRLDPLRNLLVTARLAARMLLAPLRRRGRRRRRFLDYEPADAADARLSGLRALVHRLDAARLAAFTESDRPLRGAAGGQADLSADAANKAD
jgi:glycosyltransferase involved in cell wall biosynthesis